MRSLSGYMGGISASALAASDSTISRSAEGICSTRAANCLLALGLKRTARTNPGLA